jgi:hypothetical protein
MLLLPIAVAAVLLSVSFWLISMPFIFVTDAIDQAEERALNRKYRKN